MPSTGYIYTCRKVDFSVGGVKYDVSELVITLGISAIPEVKLRIAPEKSSEGTAHIRNMSLSGLGSCLDPLMRCAASLTECDLYIVLEKHDATTGKLLSTKEINLEKWILRSAGIEDVTTMSTFYMSVVVMHPVYKLSLIGGFWTNFDCSPNLYSDEVQSATDILDAGVKAYEMLNKAMEEEPLDRPADDDVPIPPSHLSSSQIMDVVRRRFADVPKMLGGDGTYFKWSPELGGGEWPFPFWGLLDEPQKDALREIVAESWVNSGGSSEHSVWDALVSVMSDFGLAVYPYFWERTLPIAPRFPWRPVDLEIDEKDTYSVTLPGTDPCPIFGVCGTSDTTGSNGFRMVTMANDQTEAGESEGDATSVAFVPTYDYKANGKFMTVPMPSWLGAMLSRGAAYHDQGVTTGDFSENPPGPEKNESGDRNKALEQFNTCCMLYLSAVFAASYKQFSEARINCAFLPMSRESTSAKAGTDVDDWLVPTKVVSFVADGSVLFSGYVTTVSHTISVLSSTATTSIGLSYCRPPEGYMVAGGYGGTHPLYGTCVPKGSAAVDLSTYAEASTEG